MGYVVERRAVQVEVALDVDDNLHPVDLELLVVLAELDVELEVVRVPGAAASLHTHSQERVLEVLLSLDPPHALHRARRQGHCHSSSASFSPTARLRSRPVGLPTSPGSRRSPP